MDIRTHYPAIAKYIMKKHKRIVAHRNSILTLNTVYYPITISNDYLTILLKPNVNNKRIDKLCNDLKNTFDNIDRLVYNNGTNNVKLYLKGR